VGLFSQSGFVSGMLLVTEILVIVGVSLLLLSIEPWGATIVVTTLGLTAWGLNVFTKKKVVEWGERRQLHDGLRLQYLQEGLGGVKDLKLLGRETEFIKQFQEQSEMSARVGRRQATSLLLPRLFLELFAVVGIATLVQVMLFRGRSPESLLPTLGVFAAAAFRIMPSFTRIMGALQSLQYSLPVVSTLYAELQSLEKEGGGQAKTLSVFNCSLIMENVSYKYPEATSCSLEKVSLSIEKGSSVGFIGGSGAGKSTLVDILLGLLTPTSGAVKVDGRNIQDSLRTWQNRIGYVPQSIFLMDATLRRNVAFGVPEEEIDESALRRAICSAQLEEYVESLPEGLETFVGELGTRLSGGQRQRIGIARALYHNPEVLVLDEATSALDLHTESDVMKAVNALHGQKTIIIVAHRTSTVEQCDRLFRLEGGKLVTEGTPKEVLAGMYGKISSPEEVSAA